MKTEKRKSHKVMWGSRSGSSLRGATVDRAGVVVAGATSLDPEPIGPLTFKQRTCLEQDSIGLWADHSVCGETGLVYRVCTMFSKFAHPFAEYLCRWKIPGWENLRISNIALWMLCTMIGSLVLVRLKMFRRLLQFGFLMGPCSRERIRRPYVGPNSCTRL